MTRATAALKVTSPKKNTTSSRGVFNEMLHALERARRVMGADFNTDETDRANALGFVMDAIAKAKAAAP